MWVLQRTHNDMNGRGGYVAKAGHKYSYCTALTNARIYKTAEEARADSCIENEIPVSVEALLGGY